MDKIKEDLLDRFKVSYNDNVFFVVQDISEMLKPFGLEIIEMTDYEGWAEYKIRYVNKKNVEGDIRYPTL